MLRYLGKRLLFSIPTLFGVITFSFLLMHAIPGDPIDLMLGEQASNTDKQNLILELGLNKPLGEQYLSYLIKVLHFDLGNSIVSKTPTAQAIAEHFPATIELTFAALIFALCWGIPLGVWCGSKPHAIKSVAQNVFGLVGMSLPAVFLGPILVYVFSIQLEWLPVSERLSVHHLLLPAVSLAIPLGAVIFRMTHASIKDVLNEDFVRTARAKGLSERKIYLKHALKNALIPLITIVSLQLGALLTGAVITETIFDWPGVGTLLYTAITRRDYPVVQSCLLIFALIYVAVNLLTDLAYAWANPRIRLDEP